MQNLRDRHGDDSPPHPNVEASQRLVASSRRRESFGHRVRVPPPDLLTHPVQRLAEPFGAEGLQEIIEGLHFERRDSVLVESRREDHMRTMDDVPEHLEAIALGHLDVQKQQVRPEGVDGAHGRRPIARLAGNGDPRHMGQQVPQLLARQRLVVRDDGADKRRLALHASRLAGSATVAVKP